MEERIRIAGKVIFITNIVLWVICIGVYATAFGGEKYANIMRYIMILCLLLLLLVTLALLWYNWGNVTLSGLCGLTRKLLKDERDVLNDIEATATVRELAESCVFSRDNRTMTTAE